MSRYTQDTATCSLLQSGTDLLECAYLIGVKEPTTATELCTMALSLVFGRLLELFNSLSMAGSSTGLWCSKLLPCAVATEGCISSMLRGALTLRTNHFNL